MIMEEGKVADRFIILHQGTELLLSTFKETKYHSKKLF